MITSAPRRGESSEREQVRVLTRAPARLVAATVPDPTSEAIHACRTGLPQLKDAPEALRLFGIHNRLGLAVSDQADEGDCLWRAVVSESLRHTGTQAHRPSCPQAPVPQAHRLSDHSSPQIHSLHVRDAEVDPKFVPSGMVLLADRSTRRSLDVLKMLVVCPPFKERAIHSAGGRPSDRRSMKETCLPAEIIGCPGVGFAAAGVHSAPPRCNQFSQMPVGCQRFDATPGG